MQLVRGDLNISNPELPDTLNVEGIFLTRIDYN